MSNRRYSPQERIGLNEVERIVLTELNWIWREQSTTDFGIDGQIEVIGHDGRPKGKLIAVQVKSGVSYFRGARDKVPFYVHDDHVKYWDQHSLLTILVLHNPELGMTIWQWANLKTAQATEKGWRIDVPQTKLFCAQSACELQDQIWSDDSIGLRRRFALDQSFMKKFEGRDCYVSIDKWVNKHLQYREVRIYLDDPEGQPAYEIPIMATWNYEVSDIINHFLPWLDYEYFENPDDSSGEIEFHLFSVRLSQAAKGFLAAERFFRSPSFPEPDDEFTETMEDDEADYWNGLRDGNE